MENKVVDNREEQRIEREANEFANEPHYDNGGKYSSSPILYLKKGYIAGATKEAERCKPLIKALYSAKETLGLAVLLDYSDTMQNEINEIEKALQDYNKK